MPGKLQHTLTSLALYITLLLCAFVGCCIAYWHCTIISPRLSSKSFFSCSLVTKSARFVDPGLHLTLKICSYTFSLVQCSLIARWRVLFSFASSMAIIVAALLSQSIVVVSNGKPSASFMFLICITAFPASYSATYSASVAEVAVSRWMADPTATGPFTKSSSSLSFGR